MSALVLSSFCLAFFKIDWPTTVWRLWCTNVPFATQTYTIGNGHIGINLYGKSYVQCSCFHRLLKAFDIKYFGTMQCNISEKSDMILTIPFPWPKDLEAMSDAQHLIPIRDNWYLIHNLTGRCPCGIITWLKIMNNNAKGKMSKEGCSWITMRWNIHICT